MSSTQSRAGTKTRPRLLTHDWRRLVDLLTLSVAPSAVAGVIAYSHFRDAGPALIMLGSLLAATQAVARVGLPLRLMPSTQLLLQLGAPAAGAAAAWLITSAGSNWAPPAAPYLAAVLGAWLVLGAGGWLRSWAADTLHTRVAVIGSRDFASDFAVELAADRRAPYEVIGWIGPEGPPDYRRLSWLGELDGVRSAVTAERIELLVCAPDAGNSESARMEEICERVADQCLDRPVRLITASQLYEETFGHVPAGTIDAAWYRCIMHPQFRPAGPVSKRVFDLHVGGAIGLAALPFLLLAAAAIKLTDGGPILYRQRRLGERGEPFEIVKLRTMRVGAEGDGPRWTGAADERVTRVGALLRRTHLDEVPQLLNVLRGEMTLVGPRPERQEIAAELERRFPHYTRRHVVKPGITGWAQLRCGYAGSELGTAWKLCHDLLYVKRRSLVVDAVILLETVHVAFLDAHRALRAPRERFLAGEETGA